MALQLCLYDITIIRPSVCLSIRLSVKRVNCDNTKGTSVQILILYERSVNLVFQQEEPLVWDVLFYLKFSAQLAHLFQKR